MPITENDLSGVYDGDVLSASGEKIGSVGQIYLDDQTGEPTFVTANTGLFGMSQSFVPLRGARVENGNVVVDFDKTTVKDAPRIDDDGSLSPAEEDQLYAYYGMSTANVDTADYGTADQTPEPGYAQTGADDRPDLVPGDSGLGDRTDEVGPVAMMSGPTWSPVTRGWVTGPIWGRTTPGSGDQVLGRPAGPAPPTGPTGPHDRRATRMRASTPGGAPTSVARPTTTRPRRMLRPPIATRTRWAGTATAMRPAAVGCSRRRPRRPAAQVGDDRVRAGQERRGLRRGSGAAGGAPDPLTEPRQPAADLDADLLPQAAAVVPPDRRSAEAIG